MHLLHGSRLTTSFSTCSAFLEAPGISSDSILHLLILSMAFPPNFILHELLTSAQKDYYTAVSQINKPFPPQLFFGSWWFGTAIEILTKITFIVNMSLVLFTLLLNKTATTCAYFFLLMKKNSSSSIRPLVSASHNGNTNCLGKTNSTTTTTNNKIPLTNSIPKQ